MLLVCKWDRTPECTASESAFACLHLFCFSFLCLFFCFVFVFVFETSCPSRPLVLTTRFWKGELCIVRILDLCIPHAWCHVQTFLKCPQSRAVKCMAPFFYLLSGIHWAVNGRLLGVQVRLGTVVDWARSLSLDSVTCRSFKSWTGVMKQVFMGFHCCHF